MKSELQRRKLNIQNSPFTQLQFLSPIIMVSNRNNYHLGWCDDKEIDLGWEARKKACLDSKAPPPSWNLLPHPTKTSKSPHNPLAQFSQVNSYAWPHTLLRYQAIRTALACEASACFTGGRQSLPEWQVSAASRLNVGFCRHHTWDVISVLWK